MSPEDHGHATASAFDRLFHRLVVAGDRPVVRKKKKKTSKKLAASSASTASLAIDAVAENAPVLPPISSPTARPDGTAARPLSVTDRDAIVCVQRLRLCRNTRRLLTLPRDATIQRLCAGGIVSNRIVCRWRRRQQQLPTESPSPVDTARRYIRLETIAARLYSDQIEKFKSTCELSASPVLHDLCFPFVGRTFQSRIHYTQNPVANTTEDAVPAAPVINW